MITELKQLPQNIIGFILSRNTKILYCNVYKNKNPIKVYFKKKFFKSGISLGDYIILDEIYNKLSVKILYDSVKHEHGHQLQSQKYGWLYLIIIGLPSLCGNIVSKIFNKSNEWYYSQPWEHEADILGKVER